MLHIGGYFGHGQQQPLLPSFLAVVDDGSHCFFQIKPEIHIKKYLSNQEFTACYSAFSGLSHPGAGCFNHRIHRYDQRRIDSGVHQHTTVDHFIHGLSYPADDYYSYEVVNRD
jgi:hypothetical protein